MKIILNKNTFHKVLLGLCCTVPYLSNFELTFALWSFTLLITFKNTYSLNFIKYLGCFISILFIAFVSTDFENANFYFIIRDFTYLVKPVMGLLIGYQICRFIYKNAFEIIVYVGFGVSIIHLLLILKTLLIYHNPTVALLREYSGYFSDFEVYVLILVIFHTQFQIKLSKKRYYYLLLIIGFSAFMYLSRTNFIQFLVLFLGIKGYYTMNKNAIIAMTFVVSLTLVFYSIVLLINPKRTGSGVEEFLYKVKVAPLEPFKSKIDPNDYRDFNLNYRSLERIYTVKQVSSAGTKAMIFGCGLGSMIDLKQKVYLGDMNLRFISVLHNAFMTTYLKSGIIGIIILAYSIFLLFKQKNSKIPIIQEINFLLIGSSVFLLVSNWVLMGYYFTQDSKSILVGLLFAYKEITEKAIKLNSI